MSISTPKFRLSAGRLRHRVSVQRATETRDSLNAITLTFNTLRTVWADVDPLSGRELEIAQRTSPLVTHKVTLRAFEGLKANDRFLFKNRILNIDDVLNILEQGKKMICNCTEDVS